MYGFVRVELCVGFVRMEQSMWGLYGWNTVCGFCKGGTPCVGFVRVEHRVWGL